jgi:hypothetical protein
MDSSCTDGVARPQVKSGWVETVDSPVHCNARYPNPSFIQKHCLEEVAIVRNAERACDCGAAIRCTDLGGPIHYDPIYNEFHLTIGSQQHRLVYCFSCGGKLPDSTRNRRFTTPSMQECEQAAAIMHLCRSAGDILHELGPSDATHEWDARSRWPPTDRPWRRQFVYAKRWSTLVLVVIEHADGSLSFGINGQPSGQ